jgi:hypothetical protein
MMNWLHRAIACIEADYQRSADTHLIALPLPAFASHGIDLYLKDESTHPTGSLKHRLARSLFLYSLCNGWLHEGSTVVESSSGSTAVSEAYFARLLGMPFIAVMPRSTSPEKIAQIALYGGRCHLVDKASEVYSEAIALARQTGGHYMTSSPTPSGPPTGVATTTLRKACSSRWRVNVFPYHAGSWSVRVPAAPAPPLAALCVTSGMTHRCVWPTPKARYLVITTEPATPV